LPIALLASLAAFVAVSTLREYNFEINACSAIPQSISEIFSIFREGLLIF